jgi:hypothetical protein
MRLEQYFTNDIETRLEYLGVQKQDTLETSKPTCNGIISVIVVQRGNEYFAYDKTSWEILWSSQYEIQILITRGLLIYTNTLSKTKHFMRISDGLEFSLSSDSDMEYIEDDYIVYTNRCITFLKNIITNKTKPLVGSGGRIFNNFTHFSDCANGTIISCALSGKPLITIDNQATVEHKNGMMFVRTRDLDSIHVEVYRIIRKIVAVPKCVICSHVFENRARTHAWYPCGHSNICEKCADANKDMKCPTCPTTVLESPLMKLQ